MDVCQALEPQVDALPLVRTFPHTHRRPLLQAKPSCMHSSCGWSRHPALPLTLRSAEGDPCPRTGWMEMGWHTMPTPLLPSRGLFSSCSSLKPYCISTSPQVTAGGMAHGGCPPAPSPCFAAPPSQSREHSFFLSSPAFNLFSTFTSSTSPLNKEGKKKKL